MACKHFTPFWLTCFLALAFLSGHSHARSKHGPQFSNGGHDGGYGSIGVQGLKETDVDQTELREEVEDCNCPGGCSVKHAQGALLGKLTRSRQGVPHENRRHGRDIREWRQLTRLFNRRYKTFEERLADKQNILERICSKIPDDLPQRLLEKMERRPWMVEKFKELQDLCRTLEVEESPDGVVHAVIQGTIRITVVADGETCDVTVENSVHAYGTSASEQGVEGLYAFVAAEVVGRTVCEAQAEGSGVFVLHVHGEARVISQDGQCYTEITNEVLATAHVIGEGISGSLDAVLATQAGCTATGFGSEQIVVSEIIGYTEVGDTSGTAGFTGAVAGVTGRKLLSAGSAVQSMLTKIVEGRATNPTYICQDVAGLFGIPPQTLVELM